MTTQELRNNLPKKPTLYEWRVGDGPWQPPVWVIPCESDPTAFFTKNPETGKFASAEYIPNVEWR